MGQIKRDINSITDLKRGSTNVNFVYRGTSLVWQRQTGNPTLWLANAFWNTVLSETEAGTDVWLTSGINTKLR